MIWKPTFSIRLQSTVYLMYGTQLESELAIGIRELIM